MPPLFHELVDIASRYPLVLSLLGIGSVLMLVGSALAAPWLVARLPADYYRASAQSPPKSFLLVLSRNLLGVLLVLAGVALLVLPGQGLLSILAGLALLDLPGRRAAERRLMRVRAVRSGMGWLRRRAGAPPFVFDD